MTPIKQIKYTLIYLNIYKLYTEGHLLKDALYMLKLTDRQYYYLCKQLKKPSVTKVKKNQLPELKGGDISRIIGGKQLQNISLDITSSNTVKDNQTYSNTEESDDTHQFEMGDNDGYIELQGGNVDNYKITQSESAETDPAVKNLVKLLDTLQKEHKFEI